MPAFRDGREELRWPEGDTVSVVVAGDTCFSLGKASAVADVLSGRSGDILRGVAPFLASADLRLVQWETVLTEADTPIDKAGPNLKAPAGCADFAVAGGFDVALLANNHSGDFGPRAALETRDMLERAGVRTVGVGENTLAAQRPLVIERRGFRVGIVNVAENEFGLAGPDKAGGAPLDLPENLRTLRRVVEECDVALLCVHGGNEHLPTPSPRMIGVYRAFVDAGADAVVNIHAHCPQGIEVYDGAPIIYCPGNFFFPKEKYDADDFWWTGYLPKITFDRRGAVAVEVMPFTVRPEPWRIEALPPDPRAAFLRYLAGLSAIASEPAEARRFFEAWAAGLGVRIMRWICNEGAFKWPASLQDRAAVKELMGLRNLLTCEAHHETLATAMRLVEEGRVEAALRHAPRLEALKSAKSLWDKNATI
jgi:poly-gamma-glutamate synthesis protein (capsule biosynthesis protein)